MAIIWCQLTQPIKLITYTFGYVKLHNGLFQGTFILVFFPVLPLAFLAVKMFEAIQILLTSSGGTDWQNTCPGKIFFVKPDNPLAAFLWDLYIAQSIFIGNFFMVGTNPDGIQATWSDVHTTKTFWRRHLEKCGAIVPKQLAFWDGAATMKYHPEQKRTAKAIIKVDDSYLGFGDKVMKDFDLSTDQGRKEMRGMCEKEYKG